MLLVDLKLEFAVLFRQILFRLLDLQQRASLLNNERPAGELLSKVVFE